MWATYEEFQAVEKTSSIKQTDIESLLNFSDSELAEEIGEICPVLSAALKGAMGSVNNRDKNEAKVARSTCYGTIFKIRYMRYFSYPVHKSKIGPSFVTVYLKAF